MVKISAIHLVAAKAGKRTRSGVVHTWSHHKGCGLDQHLGRELSVTKHHFQASSLFDVKGSDLSWFYISCCYNTPSVLLLRINNLQRKCIEILQNFQEGCLMHYCNALFCLRLQDFFLYWLDEQVANKM